MKLEKHEKEQNEQLGEICSGVETILKQGKSFSTAQKEVLEQLEASNEASKEAVSSLELAVYSESGETPARRDRRSLQKPLTIMNESQILDEYEQPSFNTTIDEEDLPVILQKIFNKSELFFSKKKVLRQKEKPNPTRKTFSKIRWLSNVAKTPIRRRFSL